MVNIYLAGVQWTKKYLLLRIPLFLINIFDNFHEASHATNVSLTSYFSFFVLYENHVNMFLFSSSCKAHRTRIVLCKFYFQALETLLSTCCEGQWVFENTTSSEICEINNLE